jgi:hypothetical protein
MRVHQDHSSEKVLGVWYLLVGGFEPARGLVLAGLFL